MQSPVKLDPHSLTPIYRQLADTVRHEIQSRGAAPGLALPTERELETRFDVSRVTVRLAMNVLVKEGLIERHRGKGTFVAPRRLRSDLSVLSGFYDALVADGLDVDVELLAFETRDRDGAETLFLERLYASGGVPIAVSQSELHGQATGLRREDAENRTNFEILTALLHFEIDRGELTIRAALPSERTAMLLAVDVRDPIMELHRTTFSPAGEQLGASIFSIRADGFEFGLSAGHNRDAVHALRGRRRRRF